MNGVRRVILVNDSRLVLGILTRVITKAKHLEVVGELVDLQDLSKKILETEPDWVIVNDEQDEKKLEIIADLMNAHPTIRFLTVTTDGSQVRMRWLEPHEKNLSGLSLAEILNVLTQ